MKGSVVLSTRTEQPKPRVVVVGGGYGGAVTARALDEIADVTLVEPKDRFVHAAGALRTVVEEGWEDRVFHSYDHLLTNGRVVRGAAGLVTSTAVHLSATEVLPADYVVIATGTAYPFPAKFLEADTWVVKARLERLREALAQCTNVMLVGAGPVGLELAGELTSAFPDLGVTLVEQEADILAGGDYLPELKAELRGQLEERGVRLLLGAPLGYLPAYDVGLFHDFTVHTTAGEQIDAQMWFRCYGNRAESGFLDAELGMAQLWDGRIQVGPDLRVRGFDTVFAIGDVTNLPETKRAHNAIAHGEVAATNIADLIAGRAPSATYAPAPEMVVLPLGPDGGASQMLEPDGSRRILGQAETSRIKGADLMTGPVQEMLGLS